MWGDEEIIKEPLMKQVSDRRFENDVPDDQAMPPFKSFQKIPGYNNTKTETADCPPPTPTEPVSPDHPQPEFTSVPMITERIARRALLNKVDDECCWGRNPAEKLEFTNLQSSISFHYRLETFTERRGSAYDFVPYKSGMPVDGPENGRTPPPWEINCVPDRMFVDEVMDMEVPHTACLKGCHRCHSTGKLLCSSCSGTGQVKCSTCHGRGARREYRDDEYKSYKCHNCQGSGWKRCITCHGNGKVSCYTCHGYSQLKWFIKLTVTWENKIAEHVIERTELPTQLIKEVPGNIIFQDEQHKHYIKDLLESVAGQFLTGWVWPLVAFYDNELNIASQNLVQQHNFKKLRILKQRHQIRAVPVTQCHYIWKRKHRSYFVYGLEHKVYCQSYPHKYCWGCSIL